MIKEVSEEVERCRLKYGSADYAFETSDPDPWSGELPPYLFTGPRGAAGFFEDYTEEQIEDIKALQFFKFVDMKNTYAGPSAEAG